MVRLRLGPQYFSLWRQLHFCHGTKASLWSLKSWLLLLTTIF